MTYSSVVRTMSNILDHYDHPAAHVAQVSRNQDPIRSEILFTILIRSLASAFQAMCNDILVNQLRRPVPGFGNR